MKSTALLLVFICLFFVGCGRAKLAPEVQKSLDKTVDYIGTFKLSSSRLPTHDEYAAWAKTNDLRGVVDYSIEGRNTNEYKVFIWLGERFVIYSSKTKQVTNSN